MIKKLIVEDVLKGRKTGPLTNAIIKRHPITFYYSDNNTDKDPTDRVKSGVRIRSEMVAMGLSKKGNLIVRGYVEPPSVSKTGYNKSGWRTFRVERMSNIKILDEETFDEKRPQYKEGEESKSGPMAVTYVTSDWGITKDGEKAKHDQELPEPSNEPDTTEPTTQDTTKKEPEPSEPIQVPSSPENNDDLPEPENKVPSKDPMGNDSVEVEDGDIDLNLDDVNYYEKDGQRYISQDDYNNIVSNLYKEKESNWKQKQSTNGGNMRPGQGTRKRFEYDSSLTASDFIRKNNIKISNSNELNENILRIKSLMLQ